MKLILNNKKIIIYHLLTVFLIMLISMLIYNIKNSIEDYICLYNNKIENRTIVVNDGAINIKTYNKYIELTEFKNGFIKIIFKNTEYKKIFLDNEWKNLTYLESTDVYDSIKINELKIALNILLYLALILSLIIIIIFNYYFISIIKNEVVIYYNFKIKKIIYLFFIMFFIIYVILNIASYMLISNINFTLFNIFINNYLNLQTNGIAIIIITLTIFIIYIIKIKKIKT